MSNPHMTHAMAQTYRAEMYQEARRRQLAAEMSRPSLWTRLIARSPYRQPAPAPVANPASSVASS